MSELKELKNRIRAALGEAAPDRILRNVRLLNVYSGEISTTDIAIKAGRVVSTLPRVDATTSIDHSAEILDGEGLYALPGFIDAHVHIESTLLTPAALAEVIVPAGTTSLFIDPMEIANVAGYAGLQALLEGTRDLPYRILVQASSRVPTAPGLETTGEVLGLEQVRKILEWPETISLGELDPSKVLGLSSEHLAKVLAARRLRKPANGHAIGLEGAQLEAYAAAGLADDHECVTLEQLQQRLSAGMAVMVREGSSERNLAELMNGVIDRGLDTRQLMFCTDDKHPSDILHEGHINFNVNQTIRLGLPPLQAIRMASLNAAQHFRLDDRIGSLAPGRHADILLCDSIQEIRPRMVLKEGRLVANEGRLVADLPASGFPRWMKRTVRLLTGKHPSDYAFPIAGGAARVRVIEIVPDQIINHLRQAELPAGEGCLLADREADILKLAVVERYGRNGNIGLGWVRGFGLRAGAIGGSVAHDHHNLMIVGADDRDMAVCAGALEKSQGGFVAARDGQVLALLPLPLAGLMSEGSLSQVDHDLQAVRAAAASLGCPLAAPFMTLSFVSLPSIPEAGISDLGLIDVASQSLIPVLIE